MAVDVRGLVADESSPGVELAGSQGHSWQPQLPAACRVCSILVFVLASRPPARPLFPVLFRSLFHLRKLGRENV